MYIDTSNAHVVFCFPVRTGMSQTLELVNSILYDLL